MLAHYFDHAATTPLDPRVLEAMLPFLGEACGNANSLHGPGQRARAAVERAREQVAELIGAEDPAQIVFCSGATEANNAVLASFGSLAVGPFEHSSVWEPAEHRSASVLESEGWEIFPAPPVELVSVMAVNNEVGSVWDPAALRGQAGKVHADLTQAVGKLGVELDGIDYATFSAHKFYGPKGIGALYFYDEPLAPWVRGGGQEAGLRAGTLNVPAIVGMGAAAEIAREEAPAEAEHVAALREIFLEEVATISDTVVLGGERTSPWILGLGFAGVQGETLVLEMDRRGFAISSGAACSAGTQKTSRVLSAAGVPDNTSRGAVRISFGRANDRDSTRNAARALKEGVETLRSRHS